MKETVTLHAKGGEPVWETQTETGPDVKRHEIILATTDGPMVVSVDADDVDSCVDSCGELARVTFYRGDVVVAEYFGDSVIGWREV